MIFFIAALFACCMATLAMAFSAYSRREILGANAVLVQMLGLSWWTLCYALQLVDAYFPGVLPPLSPDPLFWFKLLFIGAVVLPAGFLVFVLQYTGIIGKLRRRFLFAFALVPAITLVAIATDPWHDAFLGGFQPGRGELFRGGPAFWLHVLYSYGLALVADVLLLRFVLVASPLFRLQALALLAAALMTSLANILTISHALPEAIDGLDISPFGFLIAVVVMHYNVRRRDFLNLMPIARTRIVEHMQDSVLVTDARQRVTDFNPSAATLMKTLGRKLTTGTDLYGALPELENRPATEEDDPPVLIHEPGRDDLYLSVQHTPLQRNSEQTLGHIYVLRDVTEMKRLVGDLREQLRQNETLRQALKEQAIRDPLTGLFNRRWMEETLQRELSRAKREQGSVVLCLLDIDHFKSVNDRFGHAMGDQILQALAGNIQAMIRETDVGCRYGGEEFLLVLPGASITHGKAKIEVLRQAFAANTFAPEGPASVSFSAGLAAFPSHGDDAKTLIKRADEALYQAKAAGRNQVCLAGQ